MEYDSKKNLRCAIVFTMINVECLNMAVSDRDTAIAIWSFP